MIVVDDYPPIYDRICEVFPVHDGVIFAWGDKIFAPGSGGIIPPELVDHEEVHGDRQGNDVLGWWERYMEDPEFRLAEEIPAHQAEYLYILKHENRKVRRRMLGVVAGKLASPLYGKLITPAKAKKIIEEVIRNEC